MKITTNENKVAVSIQKIMPNLTQSNVLDVFLQSIFKL